jgi:hypothetical protein
MRRPWSWRGRGNPVLEELVSVIASRILDVF